MQGEKCNFFILSVRVSVNQDWLACVFKIRFSKVFNLMLFINYFEKQGLGAQECIVNDKVVGEVEA